MKTERNAFGRCIRCGDTAVTRTGACFYCNWKGLTGPGAELKKTIKEENQMKTMGRKSIVQKIKKEQ